MKNKFIILIIVIIIISLISGILIFIINKNKVNPEDVLSTYISYLNEQKYDEMYELLTETSKSNISKEDFINRNKKIYEGIDMQKLDMTVQNVEKIKNSQYKVNYTNTMTLLIGEVNFSNNAVIEKKKNTFKISWSSNLIFPNLEDNEKVKIKSEVAKRGNILDRNDVVLAGEGTVSSVGLVPGKMSENKDADIEKISNLLEVNVDTIKKSLNASYVKDDTFVPIKKVSSDNTELKNSLLQINGIKITTAKARTYPLGEATSHLIGYTQSITAEELKENEGKGYGTNSLIGKSGLEKQYEERLKGIDGIEIYIEDSNGNKKSTISKKDVQNGENIKLTIDSNLQKYIYEQMKNDKGLFVIMNPSTGELLATVSTPSYNANDFVLGMSTKKWESLTTDNNKPLYNRFLQTWCPGSTFKPVIGGIGLTTGKLSENDEFNYNGLSWKKDSSWGDYNITTLTPYNENKNLKNALIHSDNIFFAQAALKIGSQTIEEKLNELGFSENLNLDLPINKSQFANDNKIDTEIGLADTGYGQGQVLVNPIHMASIYSAFANNGNMVKPYIEYNSNKQVSYLKNNVFSEEAANKIKEDLIQVVEDSEGTAHDMKINGITIAGKTGTAELKQSKEEQGEILSWFNCFTEDQYTPYLIISMVENARDDGGSHYLIKKIRSLFVK